jgi:hypothetical protein
MRTLLFLVALVIGGGWFLKANLPTEDRTRGARSSLPTQGGEQGSGLVALITSMVMGHGQVPQGTARPATTPNVISANGMHSGLGDSVSGTGLARGDQLSISPELMRFMTPSLLTTTPAGTQALSPAAQLALQQIMAQARANPAAFREQLNAVAGAARNAR